MNTKLLNSLFKQLKKQKEIMIYKLWMSLYHISILLVAFSKKTQLFPISSMLNAFSKWLMKLSINNIKG